MSSSVEPRSNPTAWAAFWFALAGLVLMDPATGRRLGEHRQALQDPGAVLAEDHVLGMAQIHDPP